jgi:hypothetical protein
VEAKEQGDHAELKTKTKDNRNRTMKKLLTLAAVAAMLAFCASGAKASIGITTNYTPFNLSVTITTNTLPATNKVGIVTTTTGKVKMDNATLLTIFGGWATNTWPTGAKLVVAWDEPWNGKVLVVDKSGTNVLYNPGHTAINNTTFALDLQAELDINTGATIEKIDPTNAAGSYAITENTLAAFVLESENAYLTNLTVEGLGNATQKFTQNWGKGGDLTTWSLDIDVPSAQSLAEKYCGAGASVTGSFSTSGSGKGQNTYWYPPEL